MLEKGRVVMSNKAGLTNAELEMTQRLQMHFPRGELSPEAINFWNGASAEVIRGRLKYAFDCVLKPMMALKSCKAHVIDCDADPFIPEWWKVEEHRKDGQLEWDMTKVKLHFSPNQQNGKVVEGNKLRKELANEPVLNANVLDYLLAHSELIPEEWKGKVVFFWGTIFRYAGGDLCVRCLCWYDDQWIWNYYWLGDDWSDNDPAALRAS